MSDRQLQSLALCLLLTACVGSQEPPPEPSAAASAQARGVEHYNDGDLRAALDQFMAALHEHRLIDDGTGIVVSSINIARTFHAAGRDKLARSWIEQARKQMALATSPRATALQENLTLLSAEIHLSAGEYETATGDLSSLENSRDGRIISAVSRLKTQMAFDKQETMDAALASYEETVAAHAASSVTHRARISRFKAALEQDGATRDRLFQESIDAYRDLHKENAIASTLQEWADASDDAELKRSRLIRALYIRVSNRDVEQVLSILNSLGEIGDTELDRTTAYWSEKLQEPGFDLWRNLLQEFDQFPR